jgi:hypothetical protein
LSRAIASSTLPARSYSNGGGTCTLAHLLVDALKRLVLGT